LGYQLVSGGRVKKEIRLKMLTTFAVVAIVSLTGCAKPAATTTTTGTTTPTQTQTPVPTSSPIPKPTQSGQYGTLRLALSTFGMETLNPATADSTCIRDLLGPIMDQMIEQEGRDLGGTGVIQKFEASSDALSWIYHVRKGIKFQDGSDLTAKDVKFSIDAYIAKNAFNQSLAGLVDHTEIVDDYTVRIFTKGFQPDLPWYTGRTRTSGYVGEVVPKDYVDKNGWQYFQQHPVGSGPWKFTRHVLGDTVEYEAVASHWRQTPEFKNLINIIMPEEATRVASLKTGAVDGIDASLDTAHSLELAGFKTNALDGYSSEILLHGAYQTGAGPIADVRVRQALSLAINRDEINKTLLYGKSDPLGPPHNSVETSGFDYAYWMDYAAKAYRYDPEAAKTLLQQAGYSNGFSIKLWTYPMGEVPYITRLADVVQGYWLKIGVKAEISPTDDGSYRPIRNTLKSPVLIGAASTYGYSAGPSPVKNLIHAYHTTSGSFALVGKAMPEYDDLLNKALSEMDPAKRAEYVKQGLQIAFDSWTVLNIARTAREVVIGPQVDISFPTPAFSLSVRADLAKHKK
jgi:peptide/nickel transport system substrate-binding protein